MVDVIFFSLVSKFEWQKSCLPSHVFLFALTKAYILADRNSELKTEKETNELYKGRRGKVFDGPQKIRQRCTILVLFHFFFSL